MNNTPSQNGWQTAHTESKACRHFTASLGFAPHCCIRLSNAAAEIKGPSCGHGHCWGYARDCFSLWGQAWPMVAGKRHWGFLYLIMAYDSEQQRLLLARADRKAALALQAALVLYFLKMLTYMILLSKQLRS